jgi:hypothetical protein
MTYFPSARVASLWTTIAVVGYSYVAIRSGPALPDIFIIPAIAFLLVFLYRRIRRESFPAIQGYWISKNIPITPNKSETPPTVAQTASPSP